jgi:hypothetical protein
MLAEMRKRSKDQMESDRPPDGLFNWR